jgi:hypothetical protein
MSSTQRPDTLVQDRILLLADFSCNAPPVHTFGSGTVLQQHSVAGPLYHQIAVVVAAVPKMPALCQYLPCPTRRSTMSMGSARLQRIRVYPDISKPAAERNWDDQRDMNR